MKRLAIMFICLAMFLSLTARSRAADPDPNLVAYYTFEEGPGGAVKDWSGKGNDGRNAGAKYVTLPGGKGYALRFDFPAALVNCGRRPSLDLTDALTLELWFYPEVILTEGESGIIGKFMSSFSLSYSTGGGCWFYTSGAGGGTQTGMGGGLLNTWTHIVATFDGKSARVYRDGKLAKETKSEIKTINHGEDFYLRYPVTWVPADGSGVVEPVFKGMMDDVRVYNRALSEAEVRNHYRNGAGDKGKDVAGFGAVKLTPHINPALSTFVVEADFSEMDGLSPGCVLQLEVRDSAGKKVVDRKRISKLSKTGVSEWAMNLISSPAGDYEISAVVTDSSGKMVGAPSSVTVNLTGEKPAWVKAYAGARILNNLAAELLSVPSPRAEESKGYPFTNPRDGWVFVSSTAQTQGSDRVIVSIGGDAVIVHDSKKQPTLEAMRYLPAGTHTLFRRCEGDSRPAALVVRAVPELIYNELGYNNDIPWIKSQGPYDWQFLEKAKILENANVILERNARPENARNLNDWKGQGKKVLSYYNVTWFFNKYPQGKGTAENVFREWTDSRGFSGEGYHGTMLDELSGGSYPADLPAFTAAVTKMSQDPAFKGRAFYPYCGSMYTTGLGRNFLKAIIDGGYKWAEEVYLAEEPTEDGAKQSINTGWKLNLLRYQAVVPGPVAPSMIATLAFMSSPPETLERDPGVNYKVFMDMQMNLLANDPAFFGLYGLIWYHSAYTDEEVMRWSAKLFRHYCIEGKKEPLTADPYRLPHLTNGDFAWGTAGWTLLPAGKDSIFPGNAGGYSYLQGRYPQTSQGDTFLVTRRSAIKPNRFSQQAKELIPGKLYSLKMFITDYGDLSNRRGYTLQEAAGKVYQSAITIQGGRLLPEKSFRETFGSGLCGHENLGYNRVKNLPITYVRYVFRAEGKTANLIISDWANESYGDEPAGQELAFNFVQIQPYLED